MPALATVGIYRTGLKRFGVATVIPDPVDQGEYDMSTGIVLKDADTGEKILIKDNGSELEFYTPAGGETEVTSIVLGTGFKFVEMTYNSTNGVVEFTTIGFQDYYSSIKFPVDPAGTSVWNFVYLYNNPTLQKA